MTRRAACVLALALASASAGCAALNAIGDLRQSDRETQARLAETGAAVDDLAREIAALRKRLDALQRTASEQREMDKRLRALEARLGSGRDAGAMSAAVITAGTPSEPPALDAEALRREESRDGPAAYRRGLALVRDGAYQRAVKELRDFIHTHPNATLLPNAHYWIGESYLQLGEYHQAIVSFSTVAERYPASERAPASLLKIGLAFLHLGNQSEARRALQKVLAGHAGSPDAARARRELEALDR